MRKRSNKLIAVLLAATIIGGAMTGCGSNVEPKPTEPSSSEVKETPGSVEPSSSEEVEESLDPVHFVVWIAQAAGSDDKIVEKAFNELEELKELNVTVEFKTTPAGDKFDQKLDLALAAKEDVDIVLGDFGANAYARMRNGAYADISELLDTKYTSLRDTLLPDHWTNVTIDGGIYGVPSYKESSTHAMFLVQQSVVDKYNLDLSNRTVLDLTDVLEALKDDGRATFMLKYSAMSYLRDAMAEINHIKLNRWITSATYEDPRTVVNFYETDDWKELCLQTREWYENGLIASDILTKENFTAETNDENLCGLIYTQGDYLSLYAQKAARGMDLAELQISPDNYTVAGNNYNACVTTTCDDIDRAVAFIELLFTNSNVKNMITYGIEGMHYDLVNGQVDWTNYPDHATAWATSNTKIGNVLISYPPVGYPEEGYALYAEYAKTARKSPTTGFVLDTSNITNEINAVKAVEIEYVNMLACGVVEDVEATIAEMNQKMYDNGLQTIIDEAQKQLDAWWAAK
ncbi:MAG: DUF3502 domain-containing protein [Lachnospiraceae bacterium]|nr:DUF3502 domain-containing protein [Lachnospiraceae bacterium]